MSNLAGSATLEWRRFGLLVLASAVGFSFMSFMNPAVGVFMEPLAKDFGWNRTQLSAGIAIAGLLGIPLAPFVGYLIDRIGTRRIAIVGIILTAGAVSAFSLLNGSFAQWIGLWVAWGLCSILVQATIWSTAVSGVFSHGRGLALGVTMSGSAVATTIAPLLANTLINDFGWRMAFVYLGLGWGGLTLLLVLLFLFDVHDLRKRRIAGGSNREAEEKSAASLPGLTIPQAWRNSALWRIALSTFLILTITIAISVHQFPILVEAGLTRDNAAWILTLVGLAGVAGKLITGTLIDHFHARWIGGITLASTAIAYPLLMAPLATPLLIVIGIMISGYAQGTKMQLCSYLTARYAGIRNFGTIFGMMTVAIALASVVGPLMAGVLHDRFGNYGALLLIGVVVSLVSGGLILSLGRYPDFSSEPTSA